MRSIAGRFGFLFTFLALVTAVISVRAQDLKCDICGQLIVNNYTHLQDLAVGGEKTVCETCCRLPDRCFFCNLPIPGNGKPLVDGRILCARCAKEEISSEEEAKDIAFGVRDDMNHLFSRYLTIPETNIVISIVNRFYLDNLFRSPAAGQACVTIYGATTSNPLPGRRLVHSVSVLSDLRKSRLMAVCAHEFTHAWMAENVSRERRTALTGETVEGFCELVACKFMESKHEDFETEIIRTNAYTKGQVNVLLAADERYGFNTVMDWIKSGDDRELSMTNLDRVRALEDAEYHPAPTLAALFNIPPVAPTPVPDHLMLKGISGAVGHQLVLINDATLAPMERSKVRVGQTNVMVRCLEIRAQSVVIQVGDSKERQELFLRPGL